MDSPNVYAAALGRAAVAVGGEARLAEVLGVAPGELRSWLEGAARPPTEIYQKALDLLIGVGSH
jgi:hypothetical protein